MDVFNKFFTHFPVILIEILEMFKTVWSIDSNWNISGESIPVIKKLLSTLNTFIKDFLLPLKNFEKNLELRKEKEARKKDKIFPSSLCIFAECGFPDEIKFS